MPFSEETDEGVFSPSSVNLTDKGGKMQKPKLIVHETYKGKQCTEEVFAAVFLSAAGLTESIYPGIIKETEQSQDSLCSRKGAIHGTSEA